MARWSWLLLLPVAAAASGMLYQWIGSLNDRRRFLRLGTLVKLGNGTRLYVAQSGPGPSDAGSESPAVIFESGIAATSQNWLLLQRSVSTFARTMSYDRAGLGWSSASTSERTPSNIVPELHRLLQQAGIPPPYVLVGHSFGGLCVRRFATEYPEEVVGMVLLDAMRTEDWPPINPAQSAMVARGLRMTGYAVPIARFGLARLATTSLLCRSGRASRMFSNAAGASGRHVLDRIVCEVGKMPREVWPIVAAHWSSPGFYRGLAAHLAAIPATVREMHDAPPVCGIPIRLLTANTSVPLSPEALRAIGPEATQMLAEESGHWVHLDQHDLVLDTIRTMVDELRSNVSDAFANTQSPHTARARSADSKPVLVPSFAAACEEN